MLSWRRIGLALGLAAILAGPAAAEDYPSHPVKIIVPFGAGGPADLYARIVGQHLSQDLKQSFVVENRPGAGAVIGTNEVVKAAPDGYTLLMMSNTQTSNETLLKSKPYDLMRDLVPVAAINSSDLVMVVNPSVKAKDLNEFIALAKAKPGTLNYASSGTGTPYHMAGELFKSMSDTDIVHVPYRSSGEARTAVIGGQVQMMFDAISTMAPNVKAGQVRALGVTGTQRSSVLPDVPTIAEAGLLGYQATIWLGIMAPKGTPQPVVDKLNAEIGKVLRRPDVVEAWAKQGAVPLVMTPGAFGEYLRGDIKKWAEVIKKADIKVQ